MSSTSLMIALLLAHYIGDWVCQPRWMAMNKSKILDVLFLHVCIVSAVLVVPLIFSGLSIMTILLGLGTNALIHMLIDWNLWRFYKARIVKLPEPDKFEYWNDKNFYDMIGLDQFLHVATLALLFL